MDTPGAREAMRLRIIMESFLAVNPNMTLTEAIPAIFATEVKTAQLESIAEAPATASAAFNLPDQSRETISKWIDLTPDVQDLITGGKKINAIKEVRTRCNFRGSYVGLREAKDGVEYWARGIGMGMSPSTYSSPTTYAAASTRTMSSSIALWIEQPGQEDIMDYGIGSKRIQAIKEIRSRFPGGAGLKEAKDGFEAWEKKRGISHPRY